MFPLSELPECNYIGVTSFFAKLPSDFFVRETEAQNHISNIQREAQSVYVVINTLLSKIDFFFEHGFLCVAIFSFKTKSSQQRVPLASFGGNI